jgi:hypothetical protein
MKISNIKQWKTTLIGSVILIAAITSVFVGSSWSESAIGICIGTIFLFAPDKIINIVTKFFTK